MSNRVARSLILLLSAFTFACTYETDEQMSEFQNFAVFSQNPSRVVDALTAELVARNALSADLAEELETSVLSTFGSRSEAFLNSGTSSVTKVGATFSSSRWKRHRMAGCG
jgi:hypothetical protein